MTDLTRRQEETLRKLLDIYLSIKEPLHYSEVAEKLGVSRFTAYDMLRVLEEKGYVESGYRLDKPRGGPGRSEVVFEPSAKARKDFMELAQMQDLGEEVDWESAKEEILSKLRDGQVPALDMMQDMLDRISSQENGELAYCAEVMRVIALRLKQGSGRRLLMEYIPHLIPDVDSITAEQLSLIGGFSLGVLTMENADDKAWCLEMYEHVDRYLRVVNELTPENQQTLAQLIREVADFFQHEDEE